MEPNAQLLDFLSNCSLFEGVDRSKIEKIIPSLKKIQIQAGHTLLSEKSTPEGIYIIHRGKLVEIRKKKPLHHYSEKDHFSALYFLTGIEEKTHIRSVRDTELLMIPKKPFDELIDEEAKILQNISKELASNVHDSINLEKHQKRARIFALIPHSDEPSFIDFYEKIYELFKEGEDTVILQEGDSKMLSQFDEENKTLLLICSHKMNEWTNLAIHNADKVIVVASRKNKPDLSGVERKINKMNFLDRHLILLYDSDEKISDTKKWLKIRNLRTHQHVFMKDQESIRRIFRILSGRSLAVVLSGGGARGIAHIGLLLAFLERGIKIDIIGGTSVGSIMGWQYANGWGMKKLIERSPDIYLREGGLLDYTLPFTSILKGKRAHDKILQHTKDRQIEDLPITFFCASSNLTLKVPHMHMSGSTITALRASIALPGIFPPIYMDHNILVDGGLFNVLPIDMCKHFDPGKIIAVNVSTDSPRIDYKPFPPSISGWRRLLQKITLKNTHLPSFFDILSLTTEISGRTYKQKLIKEHVADLHIDLPVKDVELMDFDSYDEILNIGYEYSKKNINNWIKELGL